MRKRIAVLTAQIDMDYLQDFTEGFMEKAYSGDFDVCVFTACDKQPGTAQKEVGEANVFSLVNFSLFDGVVVMPDVLQVPGLMISIEERLEKEFPDGKVLYVDHPSDKYPYILMDQHEPVYRVTEHMIKEHGYKDIAFVNGGKWHIYSKMRLNTFLECMNDYGLEVPEDNIFNSNYWVDGGIHLIETLLNSGKKLPEAFVCGNDYMALGMIEALVKRGYRVPEDVAFAGIDSAEMGRNCPAPLTSIYLPHRQFGEYVATYIISLICGEEPPEFEYDWKLFIGRTCGCEFDNQKSQNEDASWEFSSSLVDVYASINNLTEDLVLQNNFRDIIDSVQTYSYQIREFEFFTLCLNDVWAIPEIDINETVIKSGHTKESCPVLVCGPTGKGADVVDFNARFETSQIVPEIHKEVDHPRGFIISPVYFDDITFGYAVISYGDEPKVFNKVYKMWLRTVALAIEIYRRNTILIRAKEEAEETQINDTLTGMFNYEGFTKHAKPMIDYGISYGKYNTILAIEIADLDDINSKYGRKAGDSILHDLAMMVFASADEGAMCCRFGTDVLVVAELTDQLNDDKANMVLERLQVMLEERNKSADRPIHIYSGVSTARVDNMVQMEDLVSAAVSQKNGNKSKEIRNAELNLTKDELDKIEIVRKILDENLFDYHFQPIVSAKDGSIYAYEALMRPRTERHVSPLEVIKCAGHLNRLYDVEKATFYNVLDRACREASILEGKKIFVNSIPGNQLDGEDALGLMERMNVLAGKVVVELTEQTEATDEELAYMKQSFLDMGVETAVDDYGTGYSNIVNLLRYMPNYVKIDRMLLSEIQNNPQKIHFVKDIVLFAKENKFKVLAEGVETKEELETVVKLGVDLIQGFYTARPKAEILPKIDDEIQTQIIKFNAAV